LFWDSIPELRNSWLTITGHPPLVFSKVLILKIVRGAFRRKAVARPPHLHRNSGAEMKKAAGSRLGEISHSYLASIVAHDT
jgi:hypothetical protein